MTTQNTHTPGPWTVESCRNEDGSPFLSISGQGPFGAWLADIQPGSVNGKPLGVTQRDEANARLIAAAPDLLAALKEMTELKHFTATRSEKESADAKARAAIAKAKGEA
jgi:antitoxin (DNA-binding transcriptional repressor) of toxin-antitoxin stability system